MNKIDTYEIKLSDSIGGDTSLETFRHKHRMSESFASYDPRNDQYSTFLKDSSSVSSISFDEYLTLADSAQNDLSKITRICAIVRKYINANDLFGKTYEAIETNVNTEYKLSYNDFESKRNKTKTLERAKDIIDDFNKQINLKGLLRDAIPATFAEGTYICYLRERDGKYIVDYFPLGVAVVSDYLVNNRPVILIDITKLTSLLQKTYLKTKKRKALFFDKIADEIKGNYPPEVYEAYINKDDYAKLDPERTGVVRIGNMKRKYGLTPFFRALRPLLQLEQYENADASNAKAKQKKIIHQRLSEKIMGDNCEHDGLDEMAYAHRNFMEAWRQDTVVVTTPPCVEEISYIEPKVEEISTEKIVLYRSTIMTTLGISFLNSDSDQAFTVAKISIEQLMRVINRISEQLEDILDRWYKFVLAQNGIGEEYAPEITIMDVEQMSFDVKKALAEFLYAKLNCSFDTAYGILGYSVEDEKVKRKLENAEGLDDVFKPRSTIYTNSGDAPAGRSKTDNPADDSKQDYDQDYREQTKT